MIRQARKEDLPAIGRLGYDNWMEAYRGKVDQAFLDSLSPDSRSGYYGGYLAKPGSGLLVAVDQKDAVVGFAAYTPDDELEETLLLDSLHVRKARRGTGTGSSLIAAVKALAVQAGCRRVSICVVEGNQRARSLYGRLGARHYDFHLSKAFGGSKVISEKMLWEIE